MSISAKMFAHTAITSAVVDAVSKNLRMRDGGQTLCYVEMQLFFDGGQTLSDRYLEVFLMGDRLCSSVS